MEQLEHAQVGLDDLATSHVLIYVYTHIANHAYIYIHIPLKMTYIYILYICIYIYLCIHIPKVWLQLNIRIFPTVICESTFMGGVCTVLS